MQSASELELANRNAAGVATVIMATFFWAVGSILTKHALQYFGAIELVVIELLASVASLWAVLVLRRWEKPPLITLLRLALPGLLQPGLAYGFSFVGLQWTSVSVETLLWSTESVLMLPFAAFFLGENVSQRVRYLGGLAIAGVALATLPPALETRTGATELVGAALILAAVLAACGYTVLAQVDLRNNEPLVLVALHQTAGLVLVALVWAASLLGTRGAQQYHGAVVWAEAGLAGICLFSAPFSLYLRSIRILGSARASQFLTLVPILTMLLANKLLTERITPIQAAGSGLTIVAVLAISFATARSDPAERRTLASQ